MMLANKVDAVRRVLDAASVIFATECGGGQASV